MVNEWFICKVKYIIGTYYIGTITVVINWKNSYEYT